VTYRIITCYNALARSSRMSAMFAKIVTAGLRWDDGYKSQTGSGPCQLFANAGVDGLPGERIDFDKE